MEFFNFHHHNPAEVWGIYNWSCSGENPKNLFSAGIHPKEIGPKSAEMLSEVDKLSLQDNCLAIGECGFDTYATADLYTQQKFFEEQIKMAEKASKPMMIHCVKAFGELISSKKNTVVEMAVHGFHKKAAVADALLKHGFYLSFGKPLLYDLSLQQTFASVPADKYFLETDATDIKIETIYEKAAALKKCSLRQICNEIDNNLTQFLKKSVKNG